MSNIATPAVTTFDVAAATFAGIRPAAKTYSDHAKNAENASESLTKHADIQKVWDRMAHLTDQNEKAGKKNASRGVTLDVAREVLNLPGLTLTPVEGQPQTPDQKRLEAFKRWLERNAPDAEKKARPFRVAVTASGEGGPVTGTVAIDPAAHPDVYAALLDILAAAATGE